MGVSCSARVNRNTADLLDLALQTLEDRGVETELLQLANYKLLPCQGCDYQCLYHKERDCPIQNDDVPKIWRRLEAADAIIYGVPVYSGTLPSLLKILLERSQALAGEGRLRPQITGIIILGSYGHLNVLAALAPSVMYYPFSKPVGYAMAIGWEEALENKRTREEVIALAKKVYTELSLQQEGR